MARLGRGRRIKPAILRGRSITTTPPLVRKRLVQTPVANRAANLYTRVFRRKHAHVVVRARSVPTPTPLVRKRLLQTPNGTDRAFTVARIWRRKRAHIILKAPQPGPGVPKQRQPLISRAGLQASIRARLFQPRGAHFNRNVSTPTPTPLIRKRLVLSPNASERSRLRASWLKPRPRRILRPPAPLLAAPQQRPKKPLVVASRRAALKARLLRDRPRLVRAPTWPQRPRPVVAKSSRRLRTRRQRPQILRAPTAVAVTPASPRQPIVTRNRRGQVKARLLRYKPRILRAQSRQQVRPRAPIVSSSQKRLARRLKTRRARVRIVASHVAPPAPVVVRHAPIVSRQRRDRVVRAYYVRRRSHLETSTLGAAAGFVAGPPITTATRAAGATGLTHVSTSTGRTRSAAGSGLTQVDTGPGETLADGGSGITQSSLGGS